MIAAPIALQAAQAWSNSSSNTLMIEGSVLNGGNLLTIAGPGNTAIPGNISGSGGLGKTGSGALTLSGSNTYTGGTSVGGGLLEVTATSALPGYANASKVSVGNGGTLVLGVGGTGGWTTTNLGSLLTANSNGFTTGSMLGIDTSGGTGSFSYATAISGSMGLTTFGPNTLILTGSNLYSGSTVISSGTLQLGDGESSHDGSISATGGIVNDAALVYNLVGP